MGAEGGRKGAEVLLRNSRLTLLPPPHTHTPRPLPILLRCGAGAEGPEGLQCFHQTYNPGNVKRKRRHGFLSRMTSKGGRRVVKRRKARGRRKVTA